MVDPARHPLRAARGWREGPGTPVDKARALRLRHRLTQHSLHEILEAPQATTAEALREEGFSSSMVDGFFRPFFGGVFLDPTLETSSRLFAYVFKLFAEGEAALPADGMRAIPRQLADRLPDGALRLHVTVESADSGGVTLAGGKRLDARAVVVATDGQEAARMTGLLETPAARAATCVYYAAERSPVNEPVLLLDGEGAGPVNHLCVPSDVAPSYAPPGATLVSANVLGLRDLDDTSLDDAVRGQLRGWFGSQVGLWRRLAVYRIPSALPAQSPLSFSTSQRPVRLRHGLFVCGDHRDTPSIQGALSSRRRAASAVQGAYAASPCGP